MLILGKEVFRRCYVWGQFHVQVESPGGQLGVALTPVMAAESQV